MRLEELRAQVRASKHTRCCTTGSSFKEQRWLCLTLAVHAAWKHASRFPRDEEVDVGGIQVRVEAAADPQRLLAPTASSAADAEQLPAAFKPLHGFTTADILRDQRFRVRAGPGHSFREELLCCSATAPMYACAQFCITWGDCMEHLPPEPHLKRSCGRCSHCLALRSMHQCWSLMHIPMYAGLSMHAGVLHDFPKTSASGSCVCGDIGLDESSA